MSLLANSNAIESGGYPIQRSLRFRSSASAYLSRTFGTPTNQQIWTFSTWTKLGLLSNDNMIFGGTTTNAQLYVASTGALRFEDNNAAVAYTTAVYRDPSAWYHILLAINTGASGTNKVKMYVNGVEITSFSTDNRSTYTNSYFNRALGHTIGKASSQSLYLDGYLTETVFVDGQQLTPSSFGQTDAVTGVWQPLKYMGTYGTNGFYLPFSDNTSATTLAYDKSGNGNNWTPNNISTTAGATYDSMTDVPTLTSATAANYCVFNPLWQGRTNAPTNGNLDYPASSVGIGTMDVSLFSSYWEITSAGGTTTASVYSTSAATTISVTTGLTYGFRFNSSTGALDYTTNGSSFTSLATGLTSGPYFFYVSTAAGTTASFNGGQRPFSYIPPTGFVALNTFNLTAGTITTSGTFTGNGSTDGPFVYLNGVPTAMTINGNSVTFGTNADKLANGFKVRSSSSSYNNSGVSNSYTISTTEAKFKYANAQGNP